MLGASGCACRTAKGNFHVLHTRQGNLIRQGAKAKKLIDFFRFLSVKIRKKSPS